MQISKNSSSLSEFYSSLNVFQQEAFIQTLPEKPYCMNEKGSGNLIRSKLDAIKRPLIQINKPYAVTYLVFDDDKEDAVMSWYDAGLPRPSWTTQNPNNGHCHHVYKLEVPVLIGDNTSLKAIKYMQAIYYAYAISLGADIGYSQLLTKNPLHPEWRTTYWTEESYSLEYLADFVDLPKRIPKRLEESGLGRNVTLFEHGRKWAYKEVKDYRDTYKREEWNNAVMAQLEAINNGFTQPLPYSEVRATSKSIARWVWKHHTTLYSKFCKTQGIRGKVGAKVANAKGACSSGGKARSQMYSDLRQEALKMHILGRSNSDIAKELNVSRKTIGRWLSKSGTVPSKSDNSLLLS